jgi:hypothetical protein
MVRNGEIRREKKKKDNAETQRTQRFRREDGGKRVSVVVR